MNEIRIDLTNKTVQLTISATGDAITERGDFFVAKAQALTAGREWVFIPSPDTTIQTFVGPVGASNV